MTLLKNLNCLKQKLTLNKKVIVVSFICVCTFIFTLYMVLFSLDPMIGGSSLFLASGDSMEPMISEDCMVAYYEEINTDSYEDKVVGFSPNEQINPSDRTKLEHYIFTNNYLPDYTVTHRVIEEYKSYDSNTARFTIEEGQFVNNFRNIDREASWSLVNNSEEFNGEHILVAQGDNVNTIDPLLIPEEAVVGELKGCVYERN